MSFRVGADAYDQFMGRYSVPLAPLFADLASVTAAVLGDVRTAAVESRVRPSHHSPRHGPAHGLPLGVAPGRARTVTTAGLSRVDAVFDGAPGLVVEHLGYSDDNRLVPDRHESGRRDRMDRRRDPPTSTRQRQRQRHLTASTPAIRPIRLVGSGVGASIAPTSWFTSAVSDVICSLLAQRFLNRRRTH